MRRPPSHRWERADTSTETDPYRIIERCKHCGVYRRHRHTEFRRDFRDGSIEFKWEEIPIYSPQPDPTQKTWTTQKPACKRENAAVAT